MPGDIPPKGGAEKTQQIVLKMENLDERIRKELIVAFAETVNMDNDFVNSKELWNWIKNSLKISETQIIPTDGNKLKCS
jgi:beta-lactamase class D